jgi:hypothetical protein
MPSRFPCSSTETEELRDEVRRVLDSPGFAGAKQLQAFLSYCSEAVFQGRASIEQTEIAREVLGRGDQFNPIDDPSVRKMASLLRQRLQLYYETEGAQESCGHFAAAAFLPAEIRVSRSRSAGRRSARTTISTRAAPIW